MSYGCPKCEWDDGLTHDGFYYVKDGVMRDCSKYHQKDGKITPKPPKGEKAYPVISNRHFNMGVAMEYGGSPHSWDELHKCPECNEEFTIDNSNY